MRSCMRSASVAVMLPLMFEVYIGMHSNPHPSPFYLVSDWLERGFLMFWCAARPANVKLSVKLRPLVVSRDRAFLQAGN